LNTSLPEENDKLIYVYDFLKMWTFYVEVIEISSEEKPGLPLIILTVGEIPAEAPEKEFVSEDPEGTDDIDDEYGHFDDYDFNEY
ncbi:plasmid pRiA4b ORF-3 family protein, partial [Polaribacter sp.]|nr:plasmid pRiA4b ORF-3 family protein [Polaribacter sp.]